MTVNKIAEQKPLCPNNVSKQVPKINKAEKLKRYLSKDGIYLRNNRNQMKARPNERKAEWYDFKTTYRKVVILTNCRIIY